jgi:hypothetical protein
MIFVNIIYLIKLNTYKIYVLSRLGKFLIKYYNKNYFITLLRYYWFKFFFFFKNQTV